MGATRGRSGEPEKSRREAPAPAKGPRNGAGSRSAGSRRSPRAAAASPVRPTSRAAKLPDANPLGFDGSIDAGGSPASKRALRNQGRRTMRKLLDAAMVAIDRRGYHATRVNDVVEIAKTSHGTFYLYFSNKEDLLRALVAEAAAEAQELYAALTEAPEQGATWSDLRNWVGQYSSLWRRYAPLLRAWTDLAAIDPELGTQVQQTVAAMSDALSARIKAVPGNEDVDADAAGMAVLAMLDRFHYLREFVGQPIDDACLDTLTTMVHRALFAVNAAV